MSKGSVLNNVLKDVMSEGGFGPHSLVLNRTRQNRELGGNAGGQQGENENEKAVEGTESGSAETHLPELPVVATAEVSLMTEAGSNPSISEDGTKAAAAVDENEKKEKSSVKTVKRPRKQLYESTGNAVEDWGVLSTFFSDVPISEYGNKSQRLTDETHGQFEEISRRSGVPMVHLINFILARFVERFREDIKKDYPLKGL